MIKFTISSAKEALRLFNVCQIYKGKMEIDIVYGGYAVDGYSMLGIYSLIGKTVEVQPITEDEKLINEIRGKLGK